MYKNTLQNHCTSVTNTLNKTSVYTTLINHCEYIHKYIQRIYRRDSTAFLYRFFISSRYILRYIPCDIPPCKPLVVYVSGYTMIKCVLYTCIYPPPHLYILFMYWGLCGLKILAIHHYYTPSGILTSPLIFTGSPFRYKTPSCQEPFDKFSLVYNGCKFSNLLASRTTSSFILSFSSKKLKLASGLMWSICHI